MSKSESASPICPKAFISYSWTSEEHMARVLTLAQRLIGDEVEVLLDRYDLKEGDDRFAYMERSVADPSVTKVLAITDRAYKEKVDARKGGVGVEGTIMSATVYQQISDEDNKFVAVIFEKDDQGRAYLPAMFDSKFYIDMSTDELLESNYERLVRFLYNKPLLKKPALGRRPSYLLEDDRPSLITVGKVAAVRHAVSNERTRAARGLFADYLDSLESALTTTSAAVKDGRSADLELAVREVERFVGYRNEFVHLLHFLSRHSDFAELQIVDALGGFFERIAGAVERLGQKENLKASAFGHVQFATYELFVYAAATLWKATKTEELILLLDLPLFIDANDGFGPRGTTYASLSVSITLFEGRYSGTNRQAELMHNYANAGVLAWTEICETDAILWLRTVLSGAQKVWYPRTVPHWGDVVFPSFARAESKRNFAHLVRILGTEDTLLKLRLEEVCGARQHLLGNGLSFLDLRMLLNLERINTRA